MWWRIFSAVLLIIVWCQYLIYYWYTWAYCSFPETLGVKFMIISDIHLLGHRRRSAIERTWVDWQIGTSFQSIIKVHDPSVVFVLGDQFDEGGEHTNQKQWDIYTSRLFALINQKTKIPIHYHIGNHDSSFGEYVSPALLHRYEQTFGPSNKIIHFQNETFIFINTMVWTATSKYPQVYAQTNTFIQNLIQTRQTTKYPPAYLMVHFPFYRKNDLQCGHQRVQEKGHITYTPPNFTHQVNHHVISQNESQHLLQQLQPSYIFSGHTHTICHYTHHPWNITESTVPSFSYGMRPDPSYFFGIANQGHITLHHCPLPPEPSIFATYLISACMLLALSIRQLFKSPKNLHID